MIMRVDKVATPTLIQIQPTSQWSLFRHPRSVNINGRPEKWLVSRSQTSVDDVDLLQLFHTLALLIAIIKTKTGPRLRIEWQYASSGTVGEWNRGIDLDRFSASIFPHGAGMKK